MLFVDAAPSKAVREPTNLLHLDDREFILFQFWKSGTIAGMVLKLSPLFSRAYYVV